MGRCYSGGVETLIRAKPRDHDSYYHLSLSCIIYIYPSSSNNLTEKRKKREIYLNIDYNDIIICIYMVIYVIISFYIYISFYI